VRYVKIIGLAALASLALLACVTSAAFGAKVCSTSGTGKECGGGHGKLYTGSLSGKNAGNIVFTMFSSEKKVIDTVTCTTSEAGGTITNGETGVGSINKVTFTGCSSSICSSVLASTNASTTSPWEFEVGTDSATENTNGAMTVRNVTRTFTCTFLGLPVICKYFAASVLTQVDGSDIEPKITGNAMSLATEEGNVSVCGASSQWTATYRITSPASLFIE